MDLCDRSLYAVLLPAATAAMLLLSCAQEPDTPAWDNPWDPEERRA